MRAGLLNENLFHCNRYSVRSLIMKAFHLLPIFFHDNTSTVVKVLKLLFRETTKGTKGSKRRNGIRLNDFFKRTDRRQEPYSGALMSTGAPYP